MLGTKNEIQYNLQKWVCKVFKTSAGRVKWEVERGRLKVEALVEGTHIVPYEASYMEMVQREATTLFVERLGIGARVLVTGQLMAGSPQDGRPADQMVMMPVIELEPEVAAAIIRRKEKGTNG